jgi:hypothetical protein
MDCVYNHRMAKKDLFRLFVAYLVFTCNRANGVAPRIVVFPFSAQAFHQVTQELTTFLLKRR